MKKLLTKMLTLAVACVMTVTALSGCALVEVVQDKDYAQVLAEVKVEDSKFSADYQKIKDATVIYKKDLMSSYSSYGYMYSYYYGYTAEQTLNLLAENLVKNEIVVQYAKIDLATYFNEKFSSAKKDYDFEKDFATIKLDGGKLTASSSADAFLTDYQIAKAEYNVKKSISDLIDNYDTEEEVEEHNHEELSVTARTTPTKDEEDVSLYAESKLKETEPKESDYKTADLELDGKAKDYDNLYDLNMAVYKSFDLGLTAKDGDSESVKTAKNRKRALTKAIKALKDNGFLSSKESVSVTEDGIWGCSYFAHALLMEKQSLIVETYEDYLYYTIEKSMKEESSKLDALYEDYLAMYNAQQAKYQSSITDYETALNEVKKDSFLVYNPFSGYGYVSHVLLPFTEEQKAIIADKQSKAGLSSQEYAKISEDMLDQIIVKDQRKTWVQNNYGDYDKDSEQFTFDDKYLFTADSDSELCSSAKAKLSKYNGLVTFASSHTEEDENGLETEINLYENVIPNVMSFKDFYLEYFTGLLGMNELYYGKDSCGKITYTDDAYSVFKDIMFAYSDSNAGGFDTEYGFVYSPTTSSKQYVKNFANAAAELVENGLGSYSIVGTEYGYHVMLCTKVVELGENHYENKQAFITDLSNESSTASKFRDAKIEAVTSSEVQVLASSFIDKYFNEVTLHKDVYKDLLNK